MFGKYDIKSSKHKLWNGLSRQNSRLLYYQSWQFDNLFIVLYLCAKWLYSCILSKFLDVTFALYNSKIISVAHHMTVVTSMLTHWICLSLVLRFWYDVLHILYLGTYCNYFSQIFPTFILCISYWFQLNIMWCEIINYSNCSGAYNQIASSFWFIVCMLNSTDVFSYLLQCF